MVVVNKCPFCQNKNRKELQIQNFEDIYNNLINPELNKTTRYWYECSSCNFIYRSPKLTEDEQEILYEKYRDVSFRSEKPNDYFDRITKYSNKESENYQKVSWLMKKINSYILDKKNKVLDVGCGGGVLLHKIKEMLPKSVTYGVEPNKLYADLAKKRSGAEEIKTDYFHAELFEHKFDMVVSSDVMEHVDFPDLFLNGIFSSMEEGGVFFLEIPSPTNFGKLESSHDIFNMAHHVFYTKDTLNQYLINAGFVDVDIEDIKYQSNTWKLRAVAYKQ